MAAGRPPRSRHGRLFRSSATGPGLAPLRSRTDLFQQTVSSAAEYLGSLWPNELADVAIETTAVPDAIPGTPGTPGRLPRWRADRAGHRIVLYRVPIERLGPTGRYDELQYRYLVESCVFQAAAEYLGKDPWDIAPDRYR